MLRDIFHEINQINALIVKRKTGPLKDFANRIGISEAKLRSRLKLMNNNGAQILFSIIDQSYYYVGEGEFKICFITDQEITDGSRGSINSSFGD